MHVLFHCCVLLFSLNSISTRYVLKDLEQLEKTIDDMKKDVSSVKTGNYRTQLNKKFSSKYYLLQKIIADLEKNRRLEESKNIGAKNNNIVSSQIPSDEMKYEKKMDSSQIIQNDLMKSESSTIEAQTKEERVLLQRAAKLVLHLLRMNSKNNENKRNSVINNDSADDATFKTKTLNYKNKSERILLQHVAKAVLELIRRQMLAKQKHQKNNVGIQSEKRELQHVKAESENKKEGKEHPMEANNICEIKNEGCYRFWLGLLDLLEQL